MTQINKTAYRNTMGEDYPENILGVPGEKMLIKITKLEEYSNLVKIYYDKWNFTDEEFDQEADNKNLEGNLYLTTELANYTGLIVPIPSDEYLQTAAGNLEDDPNVNEVSVDDLTLTLEYNNYTEEWTYWEEGVLRKLRITDKFENIVYEWTFKDYLSLPTAPQNLYADIETEKILLKPTNTTHFHQRASHCLFA
ncbi:MAG: hypothetical protein ACOC44_20485, partial [Promethearchaeia archaeon]